MQHLLSIRKLLFCFIILGFKAQLSGQVVESFDYDLDKKPVCILMVGAGAQTIFRDELLLNGAIISAEFGLDKFNSLGLQYSSIFPSLDRELSVNSYPKIAEGGYEVGVFSKHFVHGHLTGHRMNYFFGADFRMGVRRLNNLLYNGNLIEITGDKVFSTKLMAKLGLQWRFKHLVFELNLPMGAEWLRSDRDILTNEPSQQNYYNRTLNFSMYPSIQFGFKI